MRMAERLAARREDAARWAAGRAWHWRALLLAYLAYAGLRALADPAYRGLFGGVTFGVHELGHLVWAPLGEFLGVAGGSLSQVLLPLAVGLLFLQSREYFGIAVAGAWEAVSLFDLARYIADARALQLDLVSFSGEGSIHDWNYLLGRLGWLGHDLQIAGLVRAAGVVTLGLSLWWGLRILQLMARGNGPDRESA